MIYMAMNMTYVYAMPISEIAKHETIAHAAAAALFSPRAALWLSATIAISCFGAAATCTRRARESTSPWPRTVFSSGAWRTSIPNGEPRR